MGGDLLPLLTSFADVVAPTRAELDLTSPASIREFVRSVKPDWIINPAAYTAVDKAESDWEAAHALNAVAPAVLAAEAARWGAAFVHFSTDYVFDGSGSGRWTEGDAPNPLGVYGRTKLEGETAVAATARAYVTLRTSWIYSDRGRNFLRTILALARTREELSVVADQFGSPTWSFDLAQAVVSLVEKTQSEARRRGVNSTEVLQETSGLYHLTSAGDTSWFGFAEEFLGIARLHDPATHLAALRPIRTEEYPTPARRPKNSRLDCSHFHQAYGIQLPHWAESTRAVMARLAERT